MFGTLISHDNPLIPGLIVVNSPPGQVTHQLLPRFGFQGKIPTGQDPLRSESSLLSPVVKLFSSSPYLGVKPLYPKIWIECRKSQNYLLIGSSCSTSEVLIHVDPTDPTC